MVELVVVCFFEYCVECVCVVVWYVYYVGCLVVCVDWYVVCVV